MGDTIDIPPQFSLLTALIIGVLVAVGAVYRFFADLRKPPETTGSPDLRILGAALGDSQALDRLREELRELRAIVADAARNTVVANELMARLCDGIEDVAAAIRGARRRFVRERGNK